MNNILYKPDSYGYNTALLPAGCHAGIKFTSATRYIAQAANN